jgi:hypothetical protein
VIALLLLDSQLEIKNSLIPLQLVSSEAGELCNSFFLRPQCLEEDIWNDSVSAVNPGTVVAQLNLGLQHRYLLTSWVAPLQA